MLPKQYKEVEEFFKRKGVRLDEQQYEEEE
jgi:hypothetical protein